MDLKYITPTQTLEVFYEGKTRRFELASVSTHGHEEVDLVSALAHGLGGLKLKDTSHIWTVGWDSIVTVVDSKEEEEANAKV